MLYKPSQKQRHPVHQGQEAEQAGNIRERDFRGHGCYINSSRTFRTYEPVHTDSGGSCIFQAGHAVKQTIVKIAMMLQASVHQFFMLARNVANEIMEITFKVELGKGLQNQIQQPKDITKNNMDQILQAVICFMYLKISNLFYAS